jgi:ketosteroid isomerase-like protein
MEATTERATSPSTVVNHYLAAISSGDFDRAGAVLADDFSFRGPLAQADGRDQFLAGVETPAGAGSVLMTEWNSVRDGQMASSRLIYDTAAWNALVPTT